MENKYNLPRTLVQALSNSMSEYQRVGDISVTQLIDSPQIFRLKKQFPEAVKDDYANRIKAWMGTLVHNALKNAEHSSIVSEGRLTAEFTVNGKPVVLSGEADYYDPESKVLRDYKTASIKVKDLKDTHYEKQLNLYAYLFEQNNMQVSKLEIVYIYTDWSIKEAQSDPGYPTPTRIVEVPLWSNESQFRYIQERLEMMYNPKSECTDDDRWIRETTYAVQKPDGKRALSVHRTNSEAQQALKPGYQVVVRPGEPIRCKYYCPVSKICDQYKD